MLTATQAAQALGVSKRHLYQLASAKKIACYRFGSAVRFDPQDIEAYKQSCRSPATTPDAGSIAEFSGAAQLHRAASAGTPS